VKHRLTSAPTLEEIFSADELHAARINIVCAAVEFGEPLGTDWTFLQRGDEGFELVAFLIVESLIFIYEFADFF